jgi:O-antigen ligase
MAAASLLLWREVQGVGIGFVVLYATYLLYVLRYCSSRHGLSIDKRIVWLWLAGLGVVLGASISYWEDTSFHIGPGMGWIGAALAVSLLALEKQERAGVLRMLRKSASKRQDD